LFEAYYLIWIIDPDDLIFPRAATRVGPKYQATVSSTLDVPSPSGEFFLSPWLEMLMKAM
jgi:hypothetical protein